MHNAQHNSKSLPVISRLIPPIPAFISTNTVHLSQLGSDGHRRVTFFAYTRKVIKEMHPSEAKAPSGTALGRIASPVRAEYMDGFRRPTGKSWTGLLQPTHPNATSCRGGAKCAIHGAFSRPPQASPRRLQEGKKAKKPIRAHPIAQHDGMAEPRGRRKPNRRTVRAITLRTCSKSH